MSGLIFRIGSVAILVLGLLIAHGEPIFSQAPSDRVWLAGRYDRTRVVVYFEAVRFQGSFPRSAKDIAAPAADALFPPQALPPDALASFREPPELEHFAIGDRYDLLLDAGRVATITLTTLVAMEGDEFVGNDSYIGALGTVASEDLRFFTRDYYAVRRRGATRNAGVSRPIGRTTTFASLRDTPIPSATRQRIASLVRERMKRDASAEDRREADRLPPAVERLQGFTLSGGGLRFFASAALRSRVACATLDAWLAATPTLQVLAAELDGCYPREESVPRPRLLGAIDLGFGLTGLVVDFTGGDGRCLSLLEYHDGQNFAAMRTLWSISAGE